MSVIRSGLRWGVDRRVVPAVAASALAVAVLLVGPTILDQRPSHRFLLWNLALAWIPFVASLALEALDARRTRQPIILLAVGFIWLLFLPNAPYLVSDITHFDNGSPTPWLDLARLVSFAWAGCLLAVLSLSAVHRVTRRRAGPFVAWTVIVVSAIASGFGVALGRFSRLNSWEALTEPRRVLAEAAVLRHDGRQLAVALFFGLLLLTIYTAMSAPAARSRSL